MENPLTYLVKQRELIESYKTVFNSQHGEIVLADLMKKFLVVKDTPVSTPEIAQIEKCKRSVVIYILQRLHWTSEDKIRKIMENLQNTGMAEPAENNNIDTQIFNIPNA